MMHGAPARVLAQHLGRNLRFNGSPVRDRPQQLTSVSSSIFSDHVRLIAPVVMGAACVDCHNTHPESPKRDWKVGEVRGIQEIAISQATEPFR
jgi:hypothetical protein